MTTTTIDPLDGGQAAPAGDLGERRLLGRGRPDRSRRRAARRPRGPACRLARARRRDRQRERGDRSRPAAVRRRRDRLRRRAARARPRARCRRGPDARPPRRRRRGAALPRRVVRRGHLGVRLDVRARPRADCPRDRPRHSARRDDRACKLDAGRLPRRPVSHVAQFAPPPGRRSSRRCSGASAEHLAELFGPTSAGRTRPRPSRSASRPRRRSSSYFAELLRPDAEGDRRCGDRAAELGPPSPSWCGAGTGSSRTAPSRSRRRIWPPSGTWRQTSPEARDASASANVDRRLRWGGGTTFRHFLPHPAAHASASLRSRRRGRGARPT